MLNQYLRLITKLFRLPEFVVCKYSESRNKILYLYEVRDEKAEVIWTEELYEAILFNDLAHVQKSFKFYDNDNHLVISHLDNWTELDIIRELKN